MVPSDKYAAAALAGEIENVETAPEGTRNHALNVAAFTLKGFILAGVLDESTVEDDLATAARRVGLDEGEIRATIRSGFNAQTEARTIPEPAPARSPQEGAVRPSEISSVGRSRPLDQHLLTPTGLRTLPEPRPLMDNVLDQGTTALLYGKWASSKSFIALDWACSVATGRSWQGRPTEQAPVLYVVAEGVAGFAGRVNAWETGWRTKINDEQMKFLPMPVNLMVASEVDALAELVERGGYGFIVLDTLARCMVGGDENSARDAGMVIDAVTQLMYATPDRRGVVLGVHHTGKDGKTLRGSSAFESGVDTVYFTERDGQSVTLRRTKRKDGPESDLHTLRLTEIAGTDSCVIDTVSGENTGDNDTENVTKLKKIFSESFSQLGVSNTELRQVAEAHQISQASFYRARADLLRQGWIRNTGSGSRAYFEVANQAEEQF